MSRFFVASEQSAIPQSADLPSHSRFQESTSFATPDPQQQSFTLNAGLDPITKFLQAAEKSREVEEAVKPETLPATNDAAPAPATTTTTTTTAAASVTNTRGRGHHQQPANGEEGNFNPLVITEREFNIEDLNLGYSTTDKLRYEPSAILAVRPFAIAPNPEDLPDKSYYRIGQRPVYQNTAHAKPRKNQNGNTRYGNYDATGSMGNFSLKNNGRGFNSKARKGPGRKKVDAEDQWLEDLMISLGPSATPEEFDLMKSRFNMERKKQNGDAPVVNEEEPKNVIDHFFVRPTLRDDVSSSASISTVATEPQGAFPAARVAADSDANNINSKFFTFFKPDQEPSGQQNIQPGNEQQQPKQDEGTGSMRSFMTNTGKPLGVQLKESAPPLASHGSQFFNQQPPPGLHQQDAPPPGLAPAQAKDNKEAKQPQQQFPPGLSGAVNGKGVSFFNSLLNKHDSSYQGGKETDKPLQQTLSQQQPPSRSATQTPKTTNQAQIQQQNQQQVQASPRNQPKQLQQGPPPGFQQGPPPGFTPVQQRAPGQLPPIPSPGFNGQQLPPNFDPRQLPPWLLQQGPPGQFMAPPPGMQMPNGQRFMPPNPQMLNPQMGQIPPPQQAGQPQQQGRQMSGPPPPGFFNGPPMGMNGPPQGYFNGPPMGMNGFPLHPMQQQQGGNMMPPQMMGQGPNQGPNQGQGQQQPKGV